VLSRLRGPRGQNLAPGLPRRCYRSTINSKDRNNATSKTGACAWRKCCRKFFRATPNWRKPCSGTRGLPIPRHVALANCFDGSQRQRAARLFLDAVKRDTGFAWSGPLIDLLAQLPPQEVRPVFRDQWSDFGLRDALLLELAKQPKGKIARSSSSAWIRISRK